MMCGRFRLPDDDDFDREILWIVNKINERHPEITPRYGDIYPTDIVPILTAQHDGIQPAPVKWGFPNYQSSRVLINARAETVHEKKMFKDSVLNRRCVIPSTGFYEWDKQKQKYFFTVPQSKTLYMAGFYNVFNNELRFIIITTDANSSMKEVHHRMPVVLNKNDIKHWIYDASAAVEILKCVPPLLDKVKLDV